MIKRLLPFVAAGCLLALAPSLPAQPLLPGTIMNSATLSQPVYRVGQTTVRAGATLTISPGTALLFRAPDSRLNVEGSIVAVGTPEAHIYFSTIHGATTAAPGDWTEVYINEKTHGSILKNCEFSFGGGQAALVNPVARVMLRIDGPAAVIVEDCTFANAFGSGAGYGGPELQTFTRCAFFNNLYGGVAAFNKNRANINLVDCVLAGNYIALMGVWTPADFAGFSGNFFANIYNAVVLAVETTVASGEVLQLDSPPANTGLFGIVDGDLTVDQNGTLAVGDYTHLLFTAGSRILVSGVFRTSAAGFSALKTEAVPRRIETETNFAFFSSIPAFKLPLTLDDLKAAGAAPAPPADGAAVVDPAQSWRGIYFLRDADDVRSVVRNLWVDRADIGLSFDRASVRVDGCTVSNTVTAGMLVGGAAHPEISRSLVFDSQGDGVVCTEDAAPAISHTFITGSRGVGLLIRDTANPLLSNNVIFRNRDGVQIDGTAAPVLGNVSNNSALDDGGNVIMENTRYAVVNYTANRIMAQNLFWGTQVAADIDKLIYDDDENPVLGPVVFLPALGQNPTPTAVLTPTPTPTPGIFQLSPTPTPTTPVETFLSGTLNSDLSVSGVVHVTSSVTVLGFASLRFAPGTIVRVESSFTNLSAPEEAIYIRARNGGRISVEGKRDQPVIFTTANDGYWGGLDVQGPETRDSSIKYAHVQRALVGARLANNAAVVEQCRFQYCRVGVLAQRTAGDVNPRLRANLFMENTLGVRTLDLAQPDLGLANDDLGGNVFYLNGMDLDVVNPAAPVPAVGNYWSEAGPNGEVVRLDNSTLVRARRISGNATPAGVNVEPLGVVAGGEIETSDAVWMGTVVLDVTHTQELTAFVDGMQITEHAVHVGIDSRLRILPGTVVRVQNRINVVLLVSGRLDAIGTAARPIIFRASDTPRLPTDWRGIRFIDGSDLSEPSVLRWCEIYDAYTGVSCIHRSPLLENVKIRNFADQGVLASSYGQYDRKAGGAPAGAGNPFGIASPVLRDCDIQGGEYGLVSLNAAPQMIRSIVTSSVISSIFVSGNNVPMLGNAEDADFDNDGGNVIGGSIRFDLENNSTSVVYAQNNFWGLVASDVAVDNRIFDDDERVYSGQVKFLPRQAAVPPYFIVAGDTDGNGRFDAGDLTALAAAWHSVVGDSNYRPRLDVDGDYQVDQKDLLFISNGLTR